MVNHRLRLQTERTSSLMLQRSNELALPTLFFVSEIDFFDGAAHSAAQLTALGLLSQRFTFAILSWFLSLDFLLLG